MIALTAFRLAGYVRSHRVYQALLLTLAMLAILYGSRAPRGAEVSVLADGAVLIIPILAWAARSLLDTEPDLQRELSAVQVGGRGREVAAGLVAAFAACAVLSALGLGWALLLGVSQAPPTGVLITILLLHALATLTGTTLGALTSRAVLASPAVSIMALVLGFMAMLLLSASPLYWLTVPVIRWMRAANTGLLLDQLPQLAALSLLWCLIGLAVYVWRRR
ncbi:hypothetical protein [Nonomuraea jiangxiensis]|uniref:ABC-2 type transport system permease protein n=1 Tax=Nonomuraea jiangxiensis TaxID=633440 RepID=A0A1G9SGN1_9ACTN|nr:hypothetical protein [Nonomuraea jiangxiensis]SDM34648.1 hypothetical protein SAMN05421869_14160 [Nonomuraea jiangxiensis]